jgi:hypothetical protein
MLTRSEPRARFSKYIAVLEDLRIPLLQSDDKTQAHRGEAAV